MPIIVESLERIGELDYRNCGDEASEEELLSALRQADACFVGRDSIRIPAAISEDLGNLKLIASCVGSLRPFISTEIFDSSILVSNWGDHPIQLAEGAMCLLLAVLKDLHHQIRVVRNDGWSIDLNTHGGSLRDLDVGVYGCGIIGRHFISLLRPFGCVVRVYDPYLKTLPDGAIRVDTLQELFSHSKAIAIHAGLSTETRNSVSAELLAMLPQHGIIINTSRGDIIDQQALFDELESGRLRAGLDVLEPDWLEPGHPARKWENCILTAHQIFRDWPSNASPRNYLNRGEMNALENIKALKDDRPLQWLISKALFERMT